MVNLSNGRVIDVIESREKEDVVAWLSLFPNLEYISRDGSLTYASAIKEAHPNAYQISDRFHLLKNLTDAMTTCTYKILTSRIVIPLTMGKKVMNELLSSKPSRRDRILLVKSLSFQGRTTQEIRSLTGCSLQTIRNYIKMAEKDIPKHSEDKRGQAHRDAMEKILARVERVRDLHDKGYNIRQIVDKTGHTKKTIKNYLSSDFNPVHGQYGVHRPGKLALFRNEVVSMRSKGIPYKDIYAFIYKKGYTGSVDAIRGFIAKEKRLQKDLEGYDDAGSTEVIERKWLIKLLYKPLEKVKQLDHEQVKNVFDKYPLFKKMHDLVWDFKKILLSKEKDSLPQWITEAENLALGELNTFINGIKKDIAAVQNAFTFSYSNGLAEGSVNKLKTIKRIMYGRCSFELLRKKLLLLESRKFN